MLQQTIKIGYKLLIILFIISFGCTPGARLRTLLETVCDNTFTPNKKVEKPNQPSIRIVKPVYYKQDKYPSQPFAKSTKVKLDNYGSENTKFDVNTSHIKNLITKRQRKSKTTIKDFYLSAEPDRYRLTISLNKTTQYKVKTLKHPHRLYVDLVNSTLGHNNVQYININDGFVKSIRSGQFNNNTARLVIDLKGKVDFLIKEDKNSNQLFVEFASKYDLKPKVRKQKILMASNKKHDTPKIIIKTNRKSKTTLAQELGLKINTIIIDPGHGGRDPGAIGPSGIYEKDVTLDIAKKLAKLLTEDHQYHVYLTRKADTYVALEERTAFANKMNGDLFISIHVNANKSPSKNGIETYFLSLAQDEDARAVAAFENMTANTSFSSLNNVLADIIKNSKVKESEEFASTIQSTLIQKTHLYNRGVRRAGFVVLIGAQMPSILIETGFISNKKEERLIKNDYYRQMIAEAIYSGVKQYSQKLLAVVQN